MYLLLLVFAILSMVCMYSLTLVYDYRKRISELERSVSGLIAENISLVMRISKDHEFEVAN